MVSLKLTYLFGRSRFESLWIAHWSLMSFCSLHTIPFWDWKWTYNWSFYHPDPIEGEDGGILLFCYSMISVCGLTFYILMVSCEDRSPSLLPPSGITLTEHPSVSKSYALCNQSEIEDLSANRYRALCSILIFYCSFRTVFASRPIASDVRWWLSRPESHPMVKKFSRPSARRKKHYKKLKVIFYPSGKI